MKKYTNNTNFIFVTLSAPQTISGVKNISQLLINVEKILAISENKHGSTIYYGNQRISVKNQYQSLINELKQYKEFSRFNEIEAFSERGALISYNIIIDISKIHYAYYIPGTRLNKPCFKYYIYFSSGQTYDMLIYTYNNLSKLNN